MSIPRAWRTTAAIAALASAPLPVTLAVGDSLTVPAGGATPVAVNRADMLRWLADGERGLWIQTRNLKWFYGHFRGDCRGLNATNSLVFDTGSSDKIKRMTTVVVPGRGRCTVQTLASSSGPPKDRNARVVMQPQSQ